MKERGLRRAIVLGWVALSVPGVPEPPRPAADDPPLEQTRKNIRVLQGLPSSQLIPVMALMANSLGVTCAHCHTSDWTSDDKPAKEAARRMIRMTLDVNREIFNGKVLITCNTCHRGTTGTEGVPRIVDAGWNRSRPAAPEPDRLPSRDEVLDRYVSYLGGRERIGRIRARRLSGIVTRDSGRASAAGDFAIEQEKPNRVQVKTDLSYPPEANRWISNLFFLDLDDPDLREKMSVVGRSRIEKEDTVVVELHGKDGRLHRLEFEASRGPLRRISDELPTPVGPLPEEYVLADYRKVRGVRVPFTMEWSRGDYHVVHRLTRVELTVSR